MSFVKDQQKPEENQKVKPVQVNYKNGVDGEIHHEDPCLKKPVEAVEAVEKKKNTPPIRTVGEDPRFQQTNQTLRCYVSYTDFFRCQKILGEGHEACDWFKDVYQTFCPLRWIEDWDQAREEGRMPYHKRGQGKFPGDKYGY